jgi:hypothetical protein
VIPKTKSAVSIPSRKAITNTSETSAKLPPFATALSIPRRMLCATLRDSRRIQRIMYVRNPTATHIAVPSKMYSALPSNPPAVANKIPPTASDTRRAAPTPYHTCLMSSRRSILTR